MANNAYHVLVNMYKNMQILLINNILHYFINKQCTMLFLLFFTNALMLTKNILYNVILKTN